MMIQQHIKTVIQHGADLPASVIKGGAFRDQNLTACNFQNSTFEHCIFVNCDLGLSDFSGCTFTHCEFVNVKAEPCMFNDSDFNDCSFSNVSFLLSDLSCTDWGKVSFINTNFAMVKGNGKEIKSLELFPAHPIVYTSSHIWVGTDCFNHTKPGWFQRVERMIDKCVDSELRNSRSQLQILLPELLTGLPAPDFKDK